MFAFSYPEGRRWGNMIPCSDNSGVWMLYGYKQRSLLFEPLLTRCLELDWWQPEAFLAAAHIPGMWQVCELVTSNSGEKQKEQVKSVDLCKQILFHPYLRSWSRPKHHLSNPNKKNHYTESTESLPVSLLCSCMGLEALRNKWIIIIKESHFCLIIVCSVTPMKT